MSESTTTTTDRYSRVSRFRPAHRGQPHGYMQCPNEMDVIHPDRPGVVAGKALRTGITFPGYVSRGVYQITRGFRPYEPLEPANTYWVFEDDRFVEAKDWHANNVNSLMDVEPSKASA